MQFVLIPKYKQKSYLNENINMILDYFSVNLVTKNSILVYRYKKNNEFYIIALNIYSQI